MNSPKRLYRTNYNKIIGGVCNGIAEYFNFDPTLVRLLALIFLFTGGIAIPLYIIAVLIIPVKYY